jgi:5-methyltetrahydropteroyltriglutamate--homocysteine methyltransferase
MRASIDRILTTHVGSLPRPQDVVDALFAQDRGEPVDPEAFDATMRGAVFDAVSKQVAAGVDVVSDGETSKISYATYIRHRLTGFEIGESPRQVPSDIDEFPGFKSRLAKIGDTPKYHRPICRGPIAVKDLAPLRKDIEHLKAAMAAAGATEGFLNAASPGVIAVFQPNEHYPSQERYLEALAQAMRAEYETIVGAGLLLQIDAPDLAMGRHIAFRGASEAEFLRNARLQVEALNHALANVPADRVRVHLCWGNYEGPHHHDIPLERIIDLVLAVKAQAILFEGANPRHAHEWTVWQAARVPDDRILVPGVIDSVSNFIEHPALVAERIGRYADIVGRERVIAGTDCGFGTFAGAGAVHPPIAYAKLAAMAEGAAIATRRLWGR